MSSTNNINSNHARTKSLDERERKDSMSFPLKNMPEKKNSEILVFQKSSGLFKSEDNSANNIHNIICETTKPDISGFAKNEENKDEKYIIEFQTTGCKYSVKKLIDSRRYSVFYIFMIILSFLTFVYSIVSMIIKITDIPFLISEVFLCFLILFDLILKLISKGFFGFFRKLLNWFDIILFIFGFVSVIFYVCNQGSEKKIEGNTFIIIVVIRNAFYLFRIGVLIKNERVIRVRIVFIIFRKI